MDHVTSGAIARLLALALTAHPVEGGSTPLTSAPVLAEAMYSSFVVDGMSDVRGNFPMHHCSPESIHQSTIAAWLRVRPAYAKDGFPLLLETNGRCSSTKTPLNSSSPAPDTTTTPCFGRGGFGRGQASSDTLRSRSTASNSLRDVCWDAMRASLKALCTEPGFS